MLGVAADVRALRRLPDRASDGSLHLPGVIEPPAIDVAHRRAHARDPGSHAELRGEDACRQRDCLRARRAGQERAGIRPAGPRARGVDRGVVAEQAVLVAPPAVHRARRRARAGGLTSHDHLRGVADPRDLDRLDLAFPIQERAGRVRVGGGYPDLAQHVAPPAPDLAAPQHGAHVVPRRDLDRHVAAYPSHTTVAGRAGDSAAAAVRRIALRVDAASPAEEAIVARRSVRLGVASVAPGVARARVLTACAARRGRPAVAAACAPCAAGRGTTCAGGARGGRASCATGRGAPSARGVVVEAGQRARTASAGEQPEGDRRDASHSQDLGGHRRQSDRSRCIEGG